MIKQKVLYEADDAAVFNALPERRQRRKSGRHLAEEIT
jgi:hypothetical protein